MREIVHIDSNRKQRLVLRLRIMLAELCWDDAGKLNITRGTGLWACEGKPLSPPHPPKPLRNRCETLLPSHLLLFLMLLIIID